MKPVVHSSIHKEATLFSNRWNLLELDGNPVNSFKTPFLLFSQEATTRVSGFTGCNNLTGAVVVSGDNNLRFSPMAVTRMACLGDYNESHFLEMLQQTTEWRIEKQELFFYNGQKQLARFIAVPADNNGISQATDINGTWVLSYISGPRISFEGLYPDTKPELVINTRLNEISGNGSCNMFSCPYTLNGESIRFADAAVTRMFCPGNGESTFFDMLKKINRFHMDDNQTLILYMDETPLMRFNRK